MKLMPPNWVCWLVVFGLSGLPYAAPRVVAILFRVKFWGSVIKFQSFVIASLSMKFLSCGSGAVFRVPHTQLRGKSDMHGLSVKRAFPVAVAGSLTGRTAVEVACESKKDY